MVFPSSLTKKIRALLIGLCFFFASQPLAAYAVDLQIPLPKTNGGYVEKIDACRTGTNGVLECDGIVVYVKLIVEWLVRIAGILAMGMIVWGGTIWLLAGGNTGKVGEAKKIIGDALTGLVLMLCSVTLLSIINPKLIDLSPLNLLSVKPIKIEPSVNQGTMGRPGACCYKFTGADHQSKQVTNLYACQGIILEEIGRRPMTGTIAEIPETAFFCEAKTEPETREVPDLLCWSEPTNRSSIARSSACHHIGLDNLRLAGARQFETVKQKYVDAGYPPPTGNARMSQNVRSKWLSLLPLARDVSQKTGVDIGAIGMWPFMEGTNFNPWFDNCDDSEFNPDSYCEKIDQKDSRGRWQYDEWQLGYGIHPGNEIDNLDNAFTAMYGTTSNAQMRILLDEVLAAARNAGKPLTSVESLPDAAKNKSLSSLITDFKAGDRSSRILAGALMRHSSIGMYLMANHIKGYVMRPGQAPANNWGWGVPGHRSYYPQRIIDHIYAVYEAGI